MSENLTLDDTTVNSAASAGAVPMPAMNSANESHQKPVAASVSATPTVRMSMRRAMVHGRMGRWPKLRPPMMEPTEEMASTSPPVALPSPNAVTTPASIADHMPTSKKPVTVTMATGGRVSTAPKRRLERGMRTLPSSGDAMNHRPPPTKNATQMAIAHCPPSWVPASVARIGPTTQMISCAVASSEYSREICPELTILG